MSVREHVCERFLSTSLHHGVCVCPVTTSMSICLSMFAEPPVLCYGASRATMHRPALLSRVLSQQQQQRGQPLLLQPQLSHAGALPLLPTAGQEDHSQGGGTSVGLCVFNLVPGYLRCSKGVYIGGKGQDFRACFRVYIISVSVTVIYWRDFQ